MSKYYRNLVKKLEEEVKSRFICSDSVLKIIVLNQLHHRATTLLRAPRGSGKSTLMLLMLRGMYGSSFVVISGASEVKRGEVLGRLHLPSLEKEGVEKVVWAAFVKSEGKGLDEVNRLNPYTTANIYHMLQFGEVWAYGHRAKVEDYTLIANENPQDPTTFIHPPPFYDRFDVCVYLRPLTLSEKFALQEILEKYKGEIVETMPQVLSPEDLREIREEVEEIEIDIELRGLINTLVRDLQVCVRNRELSELKPLALCEGCHFIRDVCSKIKEGPSERAGIVLSYLVKAKIWLEGSCSKEDVFEMLRWVLPHRITLTRTKNIILDLKEIIEQEKVKMRDRESRRQWYILNELVKKFNRGLYLKAKEIALEDLVFAEELVKLEEKWISEKLIRPEESVKYNLGIEVL
ncbi:MAG: hypothetical protein DRJ52_05420 [Thermoprotei archaeon]|nr:MAG: hypothetical protein DRJ52_05420 [Thermoprotei archaeon]RLE98910.1 MAG: hypothetical protein DRJ63_06775 [Thermoprotei archaeon]HDI74591.1 hypothetical protein [Thermoprotei archaeon]